MSGAEDLARMFALRDDDPSVRSLGAWFDENGLGPESVPKHVLSAWYREVRSGHLMWIALAERDVRASAPGAAGL